MTVVVLVPPKESTHIVSTSDACNVTLVTGASVLVATRLRGRGIEVITHETSARETVYQITAAPTCWLLSAVNSAASCVVENLDSTDEFIRVSPHRQHVPIPFGAARVVLTTRKGLASVNVLVPSLAPADDALNEPTSMGAWRLDVNRKYFLVLLALCEARLRNGHSPGVPGVREVVERLRSLPSCAGITRAAVNYHIDYLIRNKLLDLMDSLPAASLNYRREGLVECAVRYGIVQEAHLNLLDPPDRTDASNNMIPTER